MAIKIDIRKSLASLFKDEAKSNCKSMCKAHFGYDKELRKACQASCKLDQVPQSAEEYRALIGQSYENFHQDEIILDSLLEEENKGFDWMAFILIAIMGVLVLKLMK